MSKIKIEDLKAFPTVAAVIGDTRANIELFKLQGVECDFEDDVSVRYAFVWMCTPQGHDFWYKIDNGVNPYAK